MILDDKIKKKIKSRNPFYPDSLKIEGIEYIAYYNEILKKFKFTRKPEPGSGSFDQLYARMVRFCEGYLAKYTLTPEVIKMIRPMINPTLEWGGGVDMELDLEIPENVVMQRGKEDSVYTGNFRDFELLFHSHPSGIFNFVPSADDLALTSIDIPKLIFYRNNFTGRIRLIFIKSWRLPFAPLNKASKERKEFADVMRGIFHGIANALNASRLVDLKLRYTNNIMKGQARAEATRIMNAMFKEWKRAVLHFGYNFYHVRPGFTFISKKDREQEKHAIYFSKKWREYPYI